MKEIVFTYLIEIIMAGAFLSVVPVAWLKLAKKEPLAWAWGFFSACGWVGFGYWLLAFSAF